MTLFTDLAEFHTGHHPHGPLTADATESAWNGYLVTVACPCGVVFRAVGDAPRFGAGSAPLRVAEL